jgi:S-DNA-T family DNA segregation ATPase FtsK/SpoIIIE
MAEIPVPSSDPVAPLAPLPKRVADDSTEGEAGIDDPIDFVDGLLSRAAVLLSTLETDVEGLRADQKDERERIDSDWQRRQETVDVATDRLARMLAHAQQIAAHKARLEEFELDVNPTVPPVPPELVTTGGFLTLMDRIDSELKAAHGITGAIRLPQIAILLNEAAAALTTLANQADAMKAQLLARSDDDLNAEQKEARASFEIGLSILQRDLELLDRSLPIVGRSWSDPEWETWSVTDAPQAVMRMGVHVHPRLSDAPIPLLVPVTCGDGLLLETGQQRDLALDGVRSLVLRVLAALPPGMARFTFIDTRNMGESVAPFLTLADYDSELVNGGAVVRESDVEPHLDALNRHVERVIERCLQGRHPTLDDYHAAIGEVVEPYRYLVVFDHPDGFTDRATSLLRGLIESGPRCGVTTIVVKAPRSKKTAHADKAFPSLVAVRSTPDGLFVESDRTGRWMVRPDVPPLLTMGAGSRHPGIFERVVTGIGTAAREIRRAPVSLSNIFAQVAAAGSRQVREDLPVTAEPVDPDDPATWWTGDATTGIGAPIGLTEGRKPISPWLDESHGGLVISGPPKSGVSTLLQTTIDSLAVLYPPEECQVLLVGLGARTAFATYGDEALPQARLVATDAERELAVSVLEAAAAILERRRVRLDVAGTERLGLSGHRAETGERLPRLVVAIDGVGELFDPDDALASSASRLLQTLAVKGPPLGLHLLLADRVADAAAEAELLARLPADMGVHVRSAGFDTDDLGTTAGTGTISIRGTDAATRFRIGSTSAHVRDVTSRDLRRRAAEEGFTAVPQVLHGDRGAELARAPLAQLAGDTDRRDERRLPRIWLGEPTGMGPPVEVLLRRQEGANLVIVSDDAAMGQGALFAAVATASMVHDRSLEVWVLDFLPLGGDFAASLGTLGGESTVHIGRRRNLSKTLDTVHRVVQDRLLSGDLAAPPRLLVLNGLGRARDLDVARPSGPVARPSGPGPASEPADPEPPAVPGPSPDGLDPVGVLEAILRDGPEVGVHTLVWCDTIGLLHRRLGPWALREFGARVGTAMSEDDSVTLLDSPYGSTLRPGHGLLYDEERGRLVKFRPYSLPPEGWSLPG